MTVMAWATAGREGVKEIGLVPCELTADGLVHPLELDTRRSQTVISYLRACNATQALRGVIVPGDSMSIAGHRTLKVLPAAHE
jgi:hypothetical protein